MKNFLLIVCLLISQFSFAKKYKFKFVFTYGMLGIENALVNYQLNEKNGQPFTKQPLSVSNNKVEEIDIDKNKYLSIEFSGYTLGNKSRKVILTRSLNIISLNKDKENIIELIFADVQESDFVPLPEILRTLSQTRYNQLLTNAKNSKFSYDNVFPIGRFILFDTKTG